MNRQIKLLQINSCNFGSTGNIMINISKTAEEYGYISYVAYANSRTNKKKPFDNSILIGSILERNIHLQLAYHTGRNGCFSNYGTKKFLKKVDEIKPDIIHLHNLHNCYINLEELFKYIKERDISVVWTLHDCWAFTGQCSHFTTIKCQKWKSSCCKCPQYKMYPESKIDKTRIMYELKRKWFTGVENLTIITPSKWLANRVKESFLKGYPVKVINNGIDLSIFKPSNSNFRKKFKLENKKILLGVANPWTKRKGLDIFGRLARELDENYKIVLVGLSQVQIKKLPQNILGLEKINNAKELAKIYSTADYFINPSEEETMGLVTVEAIACGTPAIVSNFTAVPEMINSKCGVIVNNENDDGFFDVIKGLKSNFIQEDCLQWARNFEMKAKFSEYMNVYKMIMFLSKQ